MKRPQTLIREYETTNFGDREMFGLRQYIYVRPLRNGEATVEMWGAKNNLKRKGRPLGFKKFFIFRTDEDLYRVRDVLQYHGHSPLCPDHICYHAPEIGGHSYAYHMPKDAVGKWDINYVSETQSSFLPCAPVLGSLEETKYKYCGYDWLCGKSLVEYLNLWKKYPKVEILSKMTQFQLLDEKFLANLEDVEFCRFVAKNNHAIRLHHMTASNIRMAYKRKMTCEEYMKYLADTYDRRMEARLLAEERRELERQKAERERMKEYDMKILALYNRIRSICGRYGAFDVIVPKSSSEMYDEANAMHNCIGRCYTPRQGVDCMVLFLHRDDKPCVDMEIDLKTLKIVQCRFVCNKEAMDDKTVMRQARRVLTAFKRVWKEAA